MELKEGLFTRRSVRRFTDYRVTDYEIREILEAARYAPSWANVQPCEFVVVRDSGLIEKIAETYAPQNPARKCTLACSALIIACAKMHLSGYYEDKPVTEYDSWFMFDLGMAVQNLCLRAHELELGTVVVGLMNHAKCAKLISLPDGYAAVTAIPVGKPAVAGKEGPPRRPQSEFVHLNKFGERMP